jgi:hypothetical protein
VQYQVSNGPKGKASGPLLEEADFGCRTSTKIWMLHVIKVRHLIGSALTS